jgi:plasmid stabilization system protein ParE
MSYATRWIWRPVGDPSRVVPRRLATQDLSDAAARYVAEADAATARRFIDAAEQAFTTVARQPGIGSPRHAVDLDWPGLRTHAVIVPQDGHCGSGVAALVPRRSVT